MVLKLPKERREIVLDVNSDPCVNEDPLSENEFFPDRFDIEASAIVIKLFPGVNTSGVFR